MLRRRRMKLDHWLLAWWERSLSRCRSSGRAPCKKNGFRRLTNLELRRTLKRMGTAPTSSGSLVVADGFPVALPAGATTLASILYSSALG
jgi:hypothetical protein